MKIQSKLLIKFGGLALATFVHKWMGTLDFKAAFYDRTIDPVEPDFRGPGIYIFWHEYIASPFYLRGHCNLTMLLSRHRDAEWLAQAAHHMGFESIRGSTFRGGGAALRELFRKSRNTNLTITPDGPRGPRRRLAQGPIYLSSKLRLPLILMGYGYDRPWRLPTWDRFALPRPFSRARAVVSPRLQIPPDLDRQGVEHYRQHVERLLIRLTLEAETWAESGGHKVNEVPLRREPAPIRRQMDPSHREVPHYHFPPQHEAAKELRKAG